MDGAGFFIAVGEKPGILGEKFHIEMSRMGMAMTFFGYRRQRMVDSMAATSMERENR